MTLLQAVLVTVIAFIPTRGAIIRGVKVITNRVYSNLVGSSPVPSMLVYLRSRWTSIFLATCLFASYLVVSNLMSFGFAAVAYLVFVTTLIVQGFIDAFTHYLPRVYTWLGLFICFVLILCESLITWEFEHFINAVIAMIALTIALLVTAAVSRGGLGGGDVYLAPLMGFMLGWLSFDAVIRGTIFGFLLGAIFALFLLITGRSRKHRFAFGPFLVIGSLLSLALC